MCQFDNFRARSEEKERGVFEKIERKKRAASKRKSRKGGEGKIEKGKLFAVVIFNQNPRDFFIS